MSEAINVRVFARTTGLIMPGSRLVVMTAGLVEMAGLMLTAMVNAMLVHVRLGAIGPQAAEVVDAVVVAAAVDAVPAAVATVAVTAAEAALVHPRARPCH
jgi:hypothetical protein